MKETGNIHGCICEKFGTAYYILEQPNGHAAHCYVTGNCWDGNDAIITARVRGLTDHCCDFVRTDLNTGEEEIICAGRWPEFYVRGGSLYQFWKIKCKRRILRR